MRVPTAAITLGFAIAGLGATAYAGAMKDSDALAGYVRTGKTENCLRVNDIRSSRILNKNQILFEMSGNRTYLNEPTSCPSLNRTYALSYVVTNNDLCTTTIVRIIDPSSPVPEHGSCGLGRFQELSKKTASAQ